MKKDYQKLSIAALDVSIQNDILQASIKANRSVTVEDYKDGFKENGTLENPGIVDITFE